MQLMNYEVILLFFNDFVLFIHNSFYTSALTEYVDNKNNDDDIVIWDDDAAT